MQGLKNDLTLTAAILFSGQLACRPNEASQYAANQSKEILRLTGLPDKAQGFAKHCGL